MLTKQGKSQSLSAQNNFKQQQLTFQRVKTAYTEKWAGLKEELHQKGFKDKFEVHIEAYKSEGKAEVWLRNSNEAKYKLFNNLRFQRTFRYFGAKD